MAADLLRDPARLHDRVPRRALAQRAPARGDRAVLRHVPVADHLVGDDPRRLEPGGGDAALGRDPERRRPAARHHGLGGGGHHLQLPALHDPAALREPGADRAAPARGGLRPVRPAPRRVPARDAAALYAGRRGRHAAHVHPGGGRLHQRRAARHAAAVHDRERHPEPLPRAVGLPDRRGPVVHPDGADARDRARLGPHRGHRGAARHRGGAALMGTRVRRRLLDGVLNVYAGLALLYLLVPIAIILVFSFNDPRGRFNFIWQEFSLDAWSDPFSVPGIGDALVNSLEIAAISTVIATALGTLTALALVRYEFRGRAPVNFFIFILSFVIVTVRSRLIGFDRSLEEAAQDLGATPWQTFRLVTLPLIMPGVISAALLAFALSLDDFVITNFTSGATITFPVFVWGALRVSVPPEIYVIGSMIFLFTVAMMLLTVWQQRRAERMAQVQPEPLSSGS